MKTQQLEIKDVILGAEAVLRIAKEEKSGDYKIAWQMARMQRKVMGIIGEGSQFEYARNTLMRQYTTLIKAKQPDGTDSEHRVFISDEKKVEFEAELTKLQSEKVTLPVGFLKPEDLAALKLDRPVSGGEMALAWWAFDPAEMEAMEKQIDGVALDAPVPSAG